MTKYSSLSIFRLTYKSIEGNVFYLFVYLSGGVRFIQMEIFPDIYKKTSIFISKVLTGYLKSISQLFVYNSKCRPREPVTRAWGNAWRGQITYFSSKLSRTVGCRIPKTPMTASLLPRRRCMAAAWPGKKVGSMDLRQYSWVKILEFSELIHTINFINPICRINCPLSLQSFLTG